MEESPTLMSAVGGSYSELQPGISSGLRVGGGPRGEIRAFSRASRRRLMVLLNSIDRSRVAAPVFVTLTYPRVWPVCHEDRKRHLDAFRKRLEREFGRFPCIWRLEFQERGAPHYHLLLFLEAPLFRLRRFISLAWYEVCGRLSPSHLRAGTRVERSRSWRGVNAYASKYVAKLETLSPDVPSPGRFWGVWRREMLPIVYEDTQLTLPQFFKLRRVFRRYASLHPHRTREFRRVGCFLSYQTANRLLAWLGIIGSDLVGVSSYGSWIRKRMCV